MTSFVVSLVIRNFSLAVPYMFILQILHNTSGKLFNKEAKSQFPIPFFLSLKKSFTTHCIVNFVQNEMSFKKCINENFKTTAKIISCFR